MKQLSITLVLLLTWFGAAAQHDLYKWQLKGYTGVANYYNDDKKTENYFKVYDNLLHSLELNRSLGTTFGLAANASYGNVRGMAPTGGFFSTEARMASVRLYFYTDNGWMLNTSAFVSPFFFGGYGLGNFKTDYNNTTYKIDELQLIPFGFGLKFRLSERWQLDLHTEAAYNTKKELIPDAAQQNDYNNTVLHTGFSLAYNFGFKKSAFKAPVLYAGFLGPGASPRTSITTSGRSMLDFILELDPKAVNLESASIKDSLAQKSKHVRPVAVTKVPVTSDRLVVTDTLSSINIDSVQVKQDTLRLRTNVAPVPVDSVKAQKVAERNTSRSINDTTTAATRTQAILPDSIQNDSIATAAARQQEADRASLDSIDARVQRLNQDLTAADSVRRTTKEESAARLANEARIDDSDERRADQAQTYNTDALPDTTSDAGIQLRRQQTELRAKEQELKEREQRVRDREQDARERELDARERNITNTASTDQQRFSENTNSRMVPVEQLNRAQERANTNEYNRTVYVPSEPVERTIRVKTSPIGQIDPAALLLLGRDQKRLDDLNKNNMQLRNRLDSLQSAMTDTSRQVNAGGDSLTKTVNSTLLTYMKQQAVVNDSMMQRLAYYETLLQRLNEAEPAPARGAVSGNTSVFFGLNSFTVPAASKNELTAIANFLKQNPDLKLLLTGYTDQTGNPAYNEELSRKRAAAVANFLETLGIPTARITTQHFGEDKSGGKVNPASRRVTLEITR